MAAVDDGRIPCPLCGGSVHPVAGRCKHCKQDLAALRAARAAPPPSLATIAPYPIAMPPLPNGAVPPLVTGRPAAGSPARSAWRSWPVLVIVLASVAILVAVVMMVWPPRATDAGRKILSAPPAPDRMQTDPQPHSQADPPPAVIPRATPDPLPAAPAAPADPVDPVQPRDPFAGLAGATGGAVFQAVLVHACTKLKSCPNPGDAATAMCDAFALFPPAAAPTCDAATRCFAAIDKMDCATDLDQLNPGDVMMKMQDCMTAATTC